MASKSPATPVADGDLRLIPRAKLVASPYNVRKSRTSEQVSNMVALIRGQKGIVQNLIVYPITKKNRPTGTFGVCAGETRRLGLDELAKNGEFVDYLVPCKVVSEDEAVAMSIAENAHVPMHPADEFEAFQRLVIEQKRPVEDVAAQFGVTPLIVRQRLKLAAVAPDFIELYRAGEIDLDALMALTLIDDHEKQRTLWNSLPPYNRHATGIRRLATSNEVHGGHALARFVGLDAYREAGGPIRTDLFGGDGAALLGDSALLESLALTKLQEAADQIENEPGMAWVEVHTQIPYDELYRYGHAPMVSREPTEEEAAEIERLRAEVTRIEDIDSDQLNEEEAEHWEAEYQAADEKLAALLETLEIPDPAALPYTGAVITVGNNGELAVHRDRIRPDDVKLLRKQSSAAGTGTGTGGSAAQSAPVVAHSEKLVRKLTAERTAAIRVSLAASPDIALVLLTTRLVECVMGSRSSASCLKISAEHGNLTSHAPDIATTRAGQRLSAEVEAWTVAYEAAKERGLSAFTWLLSEPTERVHALLALCVAHTVDTVQMREDTKIPGLAELHTVLGFDMATWWTATAESYFNHVPKPRILSVMTANGADVAPLTALKKSELAAAAEIHFQNLRWLPELLNTPA